MSSSSYNHETHPDLDFEMQRLRNQALLAWDKEARNLSWFGLTPQMTVLEIGCGPGFITDELCRAVPDGKVIAIEPDDVLRDKAAVYLAGRGPRVELRSGTGEANGVADASVDFSLIRMVLQHLPNPEAAVAEAARALRPGGRLVLTDIDEDMWGVIDPEITGLDVILAKRAEIQVKLGGDRRVGRTLPRLLHEAGLTDVQVEIVAVSSDELGLDLFLPQLDPARFALLVQEGLVTEAELDTVTAARDRFLEAEHPTVLMLVIMVCGTKPV